ncbi:helix-turn-helix domain-containing protein [Salinisphaera sp.]|uniref:helix-turn-helix domain-containing protein n=1 Tax=Salinisphaera sp. TaxID=1914330 RepID=UPI0025F7A442|nr:helix-turn-helix domain-containing protein [Salinisphaera sp.]
MAVDPADAAKALEECDGNKSAAARWLGVSRNQLRYALGSVESDLVAGSTRLARQNQRLQDINRVERKTFREYGRCYTAIEDLEAEHIRLLSDYEFNDPPRAPHPETDAPVGVIQIADTHFNERVDLEHNQYGWETAAKRLRKHILRCMEMARHHGCKHVVIANTGDTINSDRRLDEIVANATNRSKACVLAVDLLQQAIREVAAEFDVTVVTVSGNESRLQQEVHWHPEVASDNFDWLVHNQLELLFRDDERVTFVASDPSETVLNVAGFNLLMIHGHGRVRPANTGKDVQQIIGNYLMRGTRVDYVIFGHVHEAHVGDRHARSGSLVGTNDYSEKRLNLTGRASQLFHVATPGEWIDTYRIDVQNAEAVEGYRIDTSFATYNTKAKKKAMQQPTVHKIVI